MSVAGTRASYTQICGGEVFLVPFSAGAWVLRLPPWKKMTQKGWVIAAELGSSSALWEAELQAALQTQGKTATTQAAWLVWWAPKAVKVQDWTVNCTHISQILLAKI